MNSGTARITGLAVLTLLLCAGTILADDAPGASSGISAPALPDLSENNAVALTIDGTNAITYRDYVPLEIFPLLKSGQLELEAAKQLPYTISYSEAWAKASLEQPVMLNPSGDLAPGAKFGERFLLGNSANLALEKDQRLLAKKILWNINSIFAAQKIFDYVFDFHWLRDGKPFRTLRGDFARIAPGALGDDKRANQLFRELIRFSSPAVVENLSWLTFRFLGADEDALWVFSPAISKLRQLTGSNRSDPILRSSVSPDDFLVWSGKPELVEPSVDKEIEALVPFMRKDSPRMVLSPDGCGKVDRAAAVAQRSASRWNFDSQHFAHGAGWVPSAAIFVPRKLWRIELSSNDPFSLYGRQTLYVDQELMLPIYKIVYNRSGQLWKTVLGSFSMASSAADAQRYPYAAFVVVLDHLKGESYILDTSNVSICAQQVPGLSLGDFEPKRFDSDTKVAKIQTPTPAAATLPTEETDEL